jgi:hypothetical protein
VRHPTRPRHVVQHAPRDNAAPPAVDGVRLRAAGRDQTRRAPVIHLPVGREDVAEAVDVRVGESVVAHAHVIAAAAAAHIHTVIGGLPVSRTRHGAGSGDWPGQRDAPSSRRQEGGCARDLGRDEVESAPLVVRAPAAPVAEALPVGGELFDGRRCAVGERHGQASSAGWPILAAANRTRAGYSNCGTRASTLAM